MPTPTFIPLATFTATGNTKSVTFSSIPTDGTYSDLVIMGQVFPGTSGNDNVSVRFNSDATVDQYTYNLAEANGTSYGASLGDDSAINLAGYYFSMPKTNGNFMLHIFDSDKTNKHKSVLIRSNDAAEGVGMRAARWKSTAAINSITLITRSTGFYMGNKTTLSLYGIAA